MHMYSKQVPRTSISWECGMEYVFSHITLHIMYDHYIRTVSVIICSYSLVSRPFTLHAIIIMYCREGLGTGLAIMCNDDWR